MIRLILEHVTRDQGHVSSRLETVDITSATLEVKMQGGYGGGPNGDDFAYTKVIGAEILKPQ